MAVSNASADGADALSVAMARSTSDMLGALGGDACVTQRGGVVGERRQAERLVGAKAP